MTEEEIAEKNQQKAVDSDDDDYAQWYKEFTRRANRKNPTPLAVYKGVLELLCYRVLGLKLKNTRTRELVNAVVNLPAWLY
ncbi:MAG: hypothetical protein AB1349_12625 [Elusimicrobiota bacterium]